MRLAVYSLFETRATTARDWLAAKAIGALRHLPHWQHPSKEKRPVRVFRQGVLEICFLGVFELLGIYYDVRSSEPAIAAVKRRKNVAWRSTGGSVGPDNRQGCPIHLL